ncbi:MAG: hypothetical protein IKO55_05680 [Kiritimatiellae bacterium]|nr:hypothetical protein [Kiritimatiellia bacterium]
MNVSRHLAKCEKRERDRERFRRNAKKRSHLANVVSLDDRPVVENSPEWESDNGAGAEAVIRYAERDLRKSIIEQARERVKKHARGLLQVFDLVVKYGNNRKESIWQIVKSRHPKMATKMPRKRKSRKRGNGTRRKCNIGGA